MVEQGLARRAEIQAAWVGFQQAWRAQDAARVNEHATALASLLPTIISSIS